MTLQEKLAALPEISPQTIKGNFAMEDIMFEIQSLMVENEDNIDYDHILVIFPEVDAIASQDRYNVFNERLILKGTFLSYAYRIDMDLFNALICSAPLVLVDFKLTEILKDNELFNYVEERYYDYRKNMEINLGKILESMQNLDLDEYVQELQGGIESLQNLQK